MPHKATLSEYFRHEIAADYKHEFRNGNIVDTTPYTCNQSHIAVNFMSELSTALKGSAFRVLDSQMRISNPSSMFYTYPGCSVFDGPVHLDPNDPNGHTAVNPYAIAEFISPATEAYLRGKKRDASFGINSLQSYILVSQHTPLIEVIDRHHNGTFLYTPVSGLHSHLRLSTLQITISLAEIYAGVEFPSQADMK